MPNIASVLKAEIARLARREVRAETDTLKRLSAQYRSDIAELKRQVKSLERQLKQANRAARKVQGGDSADEPERQIRFSAKRLAAQRHRLGLSAQDFGTLVGVTGQSIYKWEQGGARPRASQLKAIAEVRALGKREARARLAAMAGE